MSHQSRRVLVCGIGNVFFADDGFGVEVAARLGGAQLPPNVEVKDFGIRAMHLAYELLEPVNLLIVADAVARGETPGTLFVLEPEVALGAGSTEPHGMDLRAVLQTARMLGATLPRTLIVGCEPKDLEERIGLSEPVGAAVDEAARLVQELVAREITVNPNKERATWQSSDGA